MNDEKHESGGESRKEEMRRRIREADAKIDKLLKELEPSREERDLEEKMRCRENAARDLPHIRDAEEKHGEIKVVPTSMGAIVLKKPNHLVYQKFSRAINSGKKLDDDVVWRLVKPCIVYPDISRVEEIVEEYPATTARLGEKTYELAKGKYTEIEGK